MSARDAIAFAAAAVGVGTMLLSTRRKAIPRGAKPVLVTGGAGYIGSHTVLELLETDHYVVVVDNLCNSSAESLKRVADITGKGHMLEFHKVDICDAEAMDKVMGLYSFDCVIHFAGLKAVGESVSKPVEYYDNNMRGTFVLISAMQRHGVNRIIFSSSATVYGTADPPVTESSTVGQGITNPYGQTKFMLERVLMDVQHANPSWGVVLLRYFNPVGAHISGRIGEDPQGIPNNLMPYIQQVAVGRRPHLNVFGGDYDTRDGTAIRDYIHVVDLAKGHLAAMQWLDKREEGVCEVFNLGTGNGVTVLEMLAAMGRAAGKQLPHKMAPRRPGDLPVVYAVPSKAEEVLGWKAELGLERMCQDSWRWVRDNPMGFSGAGEKA